MNCPAGAATSSGVPLMAGYRKISQEAATCERPVPHEKADDQTQPWLHAKAHRVRRGDVPCTPGLARDSMKDIQELADEAFRDLLAKHHRPVTLKEALRASTRRMPAND